MNERILELAKQAGIKANSEQALSPQEQLFAELIVRECVSICEDNDSDCALEIGEYFGVEE